MTDIDIKVLAQSSRRGGRGSQFILDKEKCRQTRSIAKSGDLPNSVFRRVAGDGGCSAVAKWREDIAQFAIDQYEGRRVPEAKISGANHGEKSPAIAIAQLDAMNHDQVEPSNPVAIDRICYGAELWGLGEFRALAIHSIDFFRGPAVQPWGLFRFGTEKSIDLHRQKYRDGT